MTKEQQRIAIAEACGWKWEKLWTGEFHGKPMGEQGPLRELPDYLNDLNAMHEAEKGLINEQDLKYSESLALVVKARWKTNNSYDVQRFRSATAAQRARAFLETLGLWDNGSA